MLLIKKSQAPHELVELKKEAEKAGLSDKEAYDRLKNPLKDKVRKLLMHEQGHLCAYCMRRIPDERISETDTDLSDVYIEHWHARSKVNGTCENKGLDYRNMLAVCSGNEKAPDAKGKHKRRYFTCDKKRESALLKVNPLDESTLETIFYLSDGRMKSTDEYINDDINIRLNLNCSTDAVTLPQNRKAVLDAIQAYLINLDGDMYQNCKDLLNIWENETDPKTPYIGIAIWWLKEQIAYFSEIEHKKI